MHCINLVLVFQDFSREVVKQQNEPHIVPSVIFGRVQFQKSVTLTVFQLPEIVFDAIPRNRRKNDIRIRSIGRAQINELNACPVHILPKMPRRVARPQFLVRVFP